MNDFDRQLLVLGFGVSYPRLTQSSVKKRQYEYDKTHCVQCGTEIQRGSRGRRCTTCRKDK